MVTSDYYDKKLREVVMEIQSTSKEMKYRLVKIILAAMLEDGVISESEFENIRAKLVRTLKPLIGGLE